MYVRDISFALSHMGHDVDVISGPPYPNLHDDIKLIKLPGLDLFESFVFKDRLSKFLKKKNAEWIFVCCVKVYAFEILIYRS